MGYYGSLKLRNFNLNIFILLMKFWSDDINCIFYKRSNMNL